jgi:chromosome partitioning protein
MSLSLVERGLAARRAGSPGGPGRAAIPDASGWSFDGEVANGARALARESTVRPAVQDSVPRETESLRIVDHMRLSVDVSRETDTRDARSAEREQVRSGTPVTVALQTRQTSAESGESAIDRSPDMHEVSDITEWPAVRSTGEHTGVGQPPPAGPTGIWLDADGTPSASQPYDDDQQRQSLVGSLPLVDDSTPLAVQVAEDARRRISLVGRPFPPPPRTRILTVANQKGGVGKTTTTVNVAAAMAQAGLTVVVLDIDPQGNASTALGIDHHADIPSLYDVIVEGTPLADVMQPCPDVANLWCAPATIDLAGAEIELVSMVAREMRLQKALDAYLDERHEQGLPQIDYIFIDCPPSLSLLTINAFVAATEVFIPIQCEYYALEGLSQLLKHIDLIRGHLNPRLHVSTILLTMYDGRTRLSAQVADEVRAHFSEVVVRTTVPRSVRISEAPSHSQTVMTYDPASSGALSYLEASRELAEQVLHWGHDLTLEEHA